MRPYFDIAFLVPLQEEFNTLVSVYPVESDDLNGSQYSAVLNMNATGLTGIAFLQDGMGKASATRAADAIFQDFDVGVAVVIGIAGGLSDEVAIGDVCFTGTIIDVLENAKISGKHKPKQKILFSPEFHNTDARLTFSLKYMTISPSQRGIYAGWQDNCYYHAANLIPGEFIGRKNKNEIIAIPETHDGPIVCGMVSKSEVYSTNLRELHRKLLALETESGGPFYSAGRKNVPIVTIRGVCDYADSNKSKLEADTGGETRKIAAYNAVAFFDAELRNPQFRRFLRDRRSAVVGMPGDLFSGRTEHELQAAAMQQVAAQADAQLRALSPEYKLKQRGYRGPMPRVRPGPKAIVAGVAGKARQRPEPISVLEAIVSNRVIAIDVPRTYPDNSLPWAIAMELLNIEIDDRQALPIVIDGAAIRPPGQSILKHCDIDLDRLTDCDAVRLVLIFDSALLDSKSRADFMIDQIALFPDAKIVFINRRDENVSRQSDLLVRLGAVPFAIDEVSFFEMSTFLQRNFNLPDQQAGVLALKLKEVFGRFHLNAHPSFIVGIGEDTLLALLYANRRSELIQLAVDGALSFLVASDRGWIGRWMSCRAGWRGRMFCSQTRLDLTWSINPAGCANSSRGSRGPLTTWQRTGPTARRSSTYSMPPLT